MKVTILPALCCICVLLFSESAGDMDEGNNFIFVFPEVSNRTGTNITVYLYQKPKMLYTMNGNCSVSGITKNMTIYKVHEIISHGSVEIVTGNDVSNKCMRYTMDGPFKIYVQMPSPGDFYMAMPVNSLAVSFYPVTYCETPGNPCQIEIIAVSDYTYVEIFLTGALNEVYLQYGDTWYYKGQTIQVKLMSLEVLQLQSDSDLTGSRISSNSSISVFSGSSGTTIQGSTHGMIVEQMPPVNQWGMEHVTVPTPGREFTGDYFRIVTCLRDTIVTISGESPFVISEPGHWIQRNFSGNTPRLIRSDKPILVVRLSVSERFGTEPGAPTMVVMVPNEQFVSGLTLDMPKPGDDDNVVTIVTKSRYIHVILSNDKSIEDWYQVANSTYWIAEVSADDNDCEISSTDTGAVFVAYVYGRTGDKSNSYVGGRAYADINPACVATEMEFGDNTDNDCDGLVDEDVCTLTDYNGKDCSQIISGDRDIFGTQFLVVIPKLPGPSKQQEIHLMLSTREDGVVQVNITTPLLSTSAHDQMFTFQSNTGYDVHLTTNLIITTNGLSNNTILVTSDKSMSAYITSLVNTPASGGAYRLISTDVLGKRYIVVTVCEKNDCQVVVTAAYSNTVVRVFLKLVNSSAVVSHNGANYTHGDTLKVSLLRYQSVQISCNVDMTGTEVLSNKPVAVLSGGKDTPLRGAASYDQVVEQLIPVYALDKVYMVIQTPGSRIDNNIPDRVMIITTEDDTTVKIGFLSPTVVILLFSGAVYEFDLVNDTYISGSNPLMVVQLLKSCLSTCDSAILIVPPLVQIKYYDTVFTSDRYTVYLSVYVETTASSSIKHNDSTLVGWQALNNDIYRSRTSLLLSHGVHLIKNSQTIVPFGGHITAESTTSPASFAFPLAFNLKELNKPCEISPPVLGDGIDNDCDGVVDEEICNDPSLDDDLDGMFNEDCMEYISSSSIVSSFVTSSSEMSSSIVSSEISVHSTSDISPSSTSASSDVIVQSTSVSSQSSTATTSSDVIQPTSMLNPSSSTATSYDVSTVDVSDVIQSSFSSTETCMCFCSSSLDSQSLADVVESIQKELYVDKATVSKTIRKLISIPDSRPSATGIGYLGIGLISGLFVSILVLDAATLIRDFTQLVRTLKEACHKT